MTDARSSPEDQRFEAAAAWHARLSENVGEVDWQAFTAWLESDPANRHAFDAVDAASALSADSLIEAPALTNVVPLDSVRPASTVRHLWKPLGVAASIVLGILLIQPHFAKPRAERIETGVGEVRHVKLADGSTLHLNTNTILDVALSGSGRSVRLEKGEVLFEIAPDAARPFDVDVGDRRVRVVGTAFNILRGDGLIDIAVKHGTVLVDPDDAAQGAKVTLHPGDRYTGREGLPAYQLAKMDPANVAEWQSGRLLFDDAPLEQVVVELNRYFKRPIVIKDDELRNLRFSGVLKIDDELAMLRRLAAFVPIAVQPKDDQVILERGPSK